MQQITLKIGNVIDKLKTIPTESVDCIITSPPYYCLRKYKAPDVVWGGDPNCEHEWIEQLVSLLHDNRNNLVGTQEEVHNASGTTFIKKYDSINAGKCSKCSAWSGQLGLEPDYHMYLDHLLMITAELKRVLKPTGTLWWNMGDSYNGNKEGKTDKKVSDYVKDAQDGLVKNASSSILIKSLMQLPTRFAIRMADEQNWILRNNIIWHKRNHMPSSVKDRLTNSYESIFFFTKQKRYFFNLDAIRVPNKVVGVTDMRPPGILRQKLYKNSAYNKSDDPHLAQFQKPHSGYYNYDGQARFNTLGKNPGDVLELTTQPFKGAHFAVFPRKLPEFCIKAGCPEEICSVCGKPKVNVYEPLIYSDSGKDEVVLSDNSPYSIKERKGTVSFRKLPNIEKFKIFLKQLKQEINITIDEMESKMQSQAPHHWFNGESFPSKEEWLKFKLLFSINETPYDEFLTKEYFKPAEKLASPKIMIGTTPTCNCNATFKPGVVLDPFAGSGTTMLAAKQLNRSAIGIEISLEYTKLIKKRLIWGFDPNIEWMED